MNDLPTEQIVIGSILAEPTLYLEATDVIDSETFYNPTNRDVFQAIHNLFDKGEDVTIFTVADQVKKDTGKEVDCFGYIESANGGNGFLKHCLILKEKQLARLQGALAVELSAKSSDPKQDPLDTNEFMLSQAEKIATLTTLSKPKTNSELIKSVTDKIDAASTFNGITGARTGFKELDRIYGGRQNTDLIIKAGRPAMGKTSLALCEAKYMAYEDKKKVVFFSLEMGAEQLMQRLISVHTGIPLQDIRQGTMSQEQWSIYWKEVDDLRSDNLVIIDDVYSLSGIKTTAKKLKMRGNCDAIYIDYLQLIEHRLGGRSKENEVSEISRGLKMLAKQLDVPIVALSQLSRAVESRGGDKKPMLSDLRDSGAIEQDADIVEFVYRPEYYNPDQPEFSNKAYVIISKNRNGSCKDVEFYFNKECTRFENPRDDYKPQYTNYHEPNDNDPF